MTNKMHIGPPHTPFGGMNTTLRRQQIAYYEFRKLRNVQLIDGALRRRNGMVRLVCGARTAESLSSDGTATTSRKPASAG